MTKPHRLLTGAQVRQIRSMARDPAIGPERAYRALHYLVAVNQTIKRFTTDIDAIQITSRRRQPKMRTGTLDSQFAGRWDRDKMIATARDIVLNFSLARGLINIHVNNVVGSGPVLQTRTRDPDWNERKESYFNRWSLRCDQRDVLWWGWIVRMVERCTIVDGDVGLILTNDGKLQGIEGDRIHNPPNLGDGKKCVHGVETDDQLKPLVYHIYNRGRNAIQHGQYERGVPAANFVHSFEPSRFDQTRGVSHIISAINDLQDSREVLEAIKGSMKLENMLGVVWYTDFGQSASGDPLGLYSTYRANAPDGTAEDRREVTVEQGAWSVNLSPGQRVETVERKTPSPNFEPWMLFQARLAGLALDMPLEVALMFFTRGSFSSIKGAIGQYHAGVTVKRERLRRQVCDRVCNWVIDRGLEQWKRGDKLAGLEPPPAEIDPHDHEWQWPALPYLEPSAEIDAETKAYKLRTTTLDAISARRNEDFEKVIRQQAREIKLITQIAEEEGIDTAVLLPQIQMPGESSPAGSKKSDETAESS